MRKRLISVTVATVIAVVAFLITGALLMDDKPDTASNNRVTGAYHQTQGMPNTKMSATVSDGQIEITLTLESGEEGDSDATGKYWVGTFDTSNTSDSFTVISKVDRNALNGSMFQSQDATKKILWVDGDLSFEFTVQGTKSIVHLSK